MRILCYGDSNTWGFRPIVCDRYEKNERWTGILQALTGYEIIEEGLCGRTTAFFDCLMPYRSGLEYAAPCVMSHLPLNLVIIMLGTNDAKRRYHVKASEIAEGLGEVIRQMRWFSEREREGSAPDILIIAPPAVKIAENDWGFDVEANKVIRQLEKEYEKLAGEMGCEFLRASDYVDDIGEDGVHLTARGHERLAKGLVEYLKERKDRK